MGLFQAIGRAITAIKQCEGCAMRRANWKLAKDKELAHEARMAAIKRGDDPDAIKPQAVQADDTQGTEAHATAGRQAGKASAEHEQQGVEADEGSSPVEGRVQVPRVRKARGGKASTR